MSILPFPWTLQVAHGLSQLGQIEITVKLKSCGNLPCISHLLTFLNLMKFFLFLFSLSFVWIHRDPPVQFWQGDENSLNSLR